MKKFSIRFIAILIPLYLVVYFYMIKIEPNLSGDMGNTGQIPFGSEYNENLKRNYLKQTNTYEFTTFSAEKKYKTVTIGDSFSQQAVFGYQNYLSVLVKSDILSYSPTDIMYPPEQTAIKLLNSGCFSSIETKIVVVESVGRSFVERLKNLDFNLKFDLTSKASQNTKIKPPKTITLLEKTCSWLRLSIDFQSSIKKGDLNAVYFNHQKYGNKLFFYADDLKFSSLSKNDIQTAKSNLIKLQKLFEAKGIKFIYIIAADKYDVYQSFIVNNKYPENKLLENFDSIPFVLNSKKILLPMVQNGVKDVYMINDSHWSYKASEAVAKELHRRIKLMEVDDKKIFP